MWYKAEWQHSANYSLYQAEKIAENLEQHIVYYKQQHMIGP
jgi:hypothetical protein